MAAARTSTVSLDVAGSRKELAAVVVDMVAFDCILGLPWLDAANPVVNWKTRRLLIPGAEGPVEVDLNHNPCRSRVSDASLLSLLRYSRLVKEEARYTWPQSDRPLERLLPPPIRTKN
jgi:hypothetical protein